MTVTLPKFWVVKNKLREKDKVVVEEAGSRLLIRTIEDVSEKKIYRSEIDMQGMSAKILRWELEAAYISGVDEVEVINGVGLPDQMRIIRGIISKLPGFEIVQTSFGRVGIKNIYGQDLLPIRQAIQRLAEMVRQMFAETVGCLTEANLVQARELIERDDEVDKLNRIIFRQARLIIRHGSRYGDGGVGIEEASYYRSVSMNLERIADHAINLVKYLLQEAGISDWISDKAPLAIMQELIKLLEDSLGMISNKDRQSAYRILLQCSELEQRIRALGLSNYRRKPHFALIIASLGRVRSYLTGMAEYTVDYAIGISAES